MISQHKTRRQIVEPIKEDRRGAAAVEFALIAIPMVILIFGTIQNTILSAAKLSLDTAVQNLAYDASNLDAGSAGSILTRQNFCSRTGFYLTDCASDTQLCFIVIPLEVGGVLQNPVLECDLSNAFPPTTTCCYQLIVAYPVPSVFDISYLLATLSGAVPQQKFLQSVAWIYRT